jgi:formate--tetrahydrofolate ligase
MNDRSLRNINITIKNNIEYQTSFDITAASELMSIICLSKNINDLKNRINNIIVAYSFKKSPVFLKQLGITNAILKLLEQAFRPNVVQTLESNLAIIHGGPFANIAHGCSSIISLNTSMSLSEYTIIEAGFGSDLGCEKFLNIVSNINNKTPDVIVLTVTINSLKEHSSNNKLDFNNLIQHVKNLQSFNLPFIIAINKFKSDSKTDLDLLIK